MSIINSANLDKSDVKQLLNTGMLLCVIVKNKVTHSPVKNLYIFSAKSGELLNWPSPPTDDNNSYDAYVDLWMSDDKVFVGSWSGYQYEIDLKSGQLVNGKFTK